MASSRKLTVKWWEGDVRLFAVAGVPFPFVAGVRATQQKLHMALTELADTHAGRAAGLGPPCPAEQPVGLVVALPLAGALPITMRSLRRCLPLWCGSAMLLIDLRSIN